MGRTTVLYVTGSWSPAGRCRDSATDYDGGRRIEPCVAPNVGALRIHVTAIGGRNRPDAPPSSVGGFRPRLLPRCSAGLLERWAGGNLTHARSLGVAKLTARRLHGVGLHEQGGLHVGIEPDPLGWPGGHGVGGV